MRLYLAGPMRGYTAYNFPAFRAAANELRQQGHEVVDPSAWPEDPDRTPVEVFMRKNIAAILSVDALAMLPKWQHSKGACLEVAVARAIGVPVLDAATLEPAAQEAETILQEAQRLVHGDRQASYGHPLDDYTCTAALFNAIWGPHGANRLREPLTAEDAILGMVAVKMSRESRHPKRDNRTDGCGYFACLDMTIAERARRLAAEES